MTFAYRFASDDTPYDHRSVRQLVADGITPSPVAAADRALLDRIRAGDLAAFDAMVLAHYADLCAYVASFLHRRDMAEELVQDLFFNIWKLGAQWTVRESIAAYLYSGARHAAMRSVARTRRESQWTERRDLGAVHGEAPAAPDADLGHDELNRAIARAIAALPPRSQEAFVLTRRVGMTYADAARVMGVSVKTVETQVRLALQTLRARLAPWVR